MKIIFQKKKTSGGCTLYLTTRRRRNFIPEFILNITKSCQTLCLTITKNLDILHSISRENIKIMDKN